MIGPGLQSALRQVFPPRCLSCGGLVEVDQGVCGPCWRDLSFIGAAACDLCGAPLPGDLGSDAEHCDACRTIARPWVNGRAALLYSGTGRKLTLALKHGDRLDVARPAARWMIAAAKPVLTPTQIVVPVPLHFRRRIRRRYNQSAILAEEIAHATGLTCLPDALLRPVPTPSLDGKSRDERFAALDGAIRANFAYRDIVKGADILLIDDVFTSGATFAAATEACHAANAASVSVLALARVTFDA